MFLTSVALGSLITLILTGLTYHRVRQAAAHDTNVRLVSVGNAIDRQISGYAETLYGLRSDFAHEPGLTREDFRSLVDINALIRRNPGAESVTFNRRHGSRLIVEYLEPWDPRSPILGFDINTESSRRAAASFARSSGEIAATQPVKIIQEHNARGFLLMLAAYDVSPVPVTTPARNRHFLGVLVAVFTADRMLQQSGEQRAGIDISVYDAGATVDRPRAAPRTRDWIAGRHVRRYTNYADIDVGSRRWRIVTDRPLPMSWAAPLATAAVGAALTALISGIIAAMALSRRRAVRLADQMTEDLRISEGRLREANATMRGFVDVAAHDLRAPATSISGFATMLGEPGALSADEQQRAIRAIDRQSTTMVGLIEDLLTLSSIDGGGVAPQPVNLPIGAAVADVLESAGHAAEFTVDCPTDVEAQVDPRHFQRMLANFVNNATTYGEQPFRIDVTPGQETVDIAVVDHGTGVPPDFVPRLFTKFARVDAELNPKRGTGLGLSIVRGLAVANGGDVFYEPNSPTGSRFVLRLPRV